MEELLKHLDKIVKEYNLCECFVSKFRIQIKNGTLNSIEELEEKVQPWVNAKKAGML